IPSCWEASLGMCFVHYKCATLLFALATCICGQVLIAPAQDLAHIAGTVTDTNGDLIPSATVTIKAESKDTRSVMADDNGFFKFDDIIPSAAYRVMMKARGF